MYALVTAANNSDREKSARLISGLRTVPEKTQYSLLYVTKIMKKKFREIKI